MSMISMVCKHCGEVDVTLDDLQELQVVTMGERRESLFKCPKCYEVTLSTLTTQTSQGLLQLGVSPKTLLLPEEVGDVNLVSATYPDKITPEDVFECLDQLETGCLDFVTFCHDTIPATDAT